MEKENQPTVPNKVEKQNVYLIWKITTCENEMKMLEVKNSNLENTINELESQVKDRCNHLYRDNEVYRQENEDLKTRVFQLEKLFEKKFM